MKVSSRSVFVDRGAQGALITMEGTGQTVTPGAEETDLSLRAEFRRSEMRGMVLLNCSSFDRVVSIISQFRS